MFIKDNVEKAAIKLGRLMKIRSPKEQVKSLKTEFGYLGYSYRYHDGDYDIKKHRTYDYAEATVERAMNAARTTGILLAFTTLLQQVADAGNTRADFDFFKTKMDTQLKVYDDLYAAYKEGMINVVDSVAETLKT